MGAVNSMSRRRGKLKAVSAVLFLALVFTWRPPLTITQLWDNPAKNVPMVITPQISSRRGRRIGVAPARERRRELRMS